MRLRPPFSYALLGLTALCGFVSGGESESESNLALYGAPRHNLDPVLPILDIEEKYIRSQTDGGVTAFGGDDLQCSASNPCPDGSCCNDQGHCGYRDEHCKESCVANCGANAPCGVNSKDGSQSCPLNLCCSHFGFCGASEFFCRDTTASGESTPCQKGFGKCGTVSTKAIPSCGKGSGTASRRVAYYEGWNTRRRPCDKVWPSQIDTTGLTQIVFSFATIDPTTFAVGPMHPDDEKLYTEFLGLKDGSQKWIGIGGWEFSDAGPTHQTWSLMASSKANRQAFISSLLDFLEKWDFAGVDIDWEWPGSDTRGGNAAIDKQNQVYLMKELRAALGSRGLSVVLPAQYAYLQMMDPKALEGSVDAFNVLAYDLHGPWDASIPELGPYAKPHTDLNEIDTALELFWSADVAPSMVNLGIANYGRGFALADTNCAHVNCTWTGPSKAGLCTQLDGVLSQCEIERAISDHSLKPKLIEGADVKQIVFDGQWFAYDDQHTLALKTELANNRCLGGTALWAIDYASCTGGGPFGPGGPQQSSAVPSSSTPAMSSEPVASSASPTISSAPAESSEPTASSASSAVSSAPTESSTPAASSTTPSASAKPPAPMLSSGSPSSAPATSSGSAASSTPAPSVPAMSSEAPTQSSQSMSAASGSASLTTSAVESLALSTSSTASTPNATSHEVSSGSSSQASTVSTVSSAPASSSESAASSASSVMSSAWSSVELTSSVSQQSSAGTTTSDSPAWSWSAPSTAASSSETMSLSSQTSASSRTTMSSGAQDSTSDTASSSTLWSSTQSPSASSQSASSGATSSDTTPTQSWSASSSDTTHSGPWSLTSDQSSTSFSTMTTETDASSDSSVWTWPTGISSKPSSETQSGSFSISSKTSPVTAVPISSMSSFPSFSRTSDSSTSLNSFPSFTRTFGGSVTTVTESAVASTVISAQPINSPTSTPDPNGLFILVCPVCEDHDWCKKVYGVLLVRELPEYPVLECLEEENLWCLECWPKPKWDPKMCPIQCFFADWCRPLCFDHELETPDEGLAFPWFTLWWWNLPVSGCVQNDCVADCNSWLGLSIPLIGKPFCPCIPVTCTKGEKNEKSKGGNKCKPFGCGCGWMGLPFLCPPHIKIGIDIELPNLFPGGLFPKAKPCWPFGCPPGIGPGPGPGDEGGEECGPLGCHGYCYVEGGCDPCPPYICPPDFPSPKPGPDPTPVKSRTPPEKCEEDNTTVTERFVTCYENLSLAPTTMSSVNYTQSTTLTSACLTVDFTLTGCGLLGTSTTTTLQITTTGSTKSFAPPPSFITGPITSALTATPGEPEECEKKDKKTTITNKIVSCFESIKLVPTTIMLLNSTRTETLTTSCTTREETSTLCQGVGFTTTTTATSYTRTSSEAPACSRAPLDLNNDEGDNPQPPRDGPTCSRAPLSLDDDEGDNEHPEDPSCQVSPLLLDDDEGDNSLPDSGGLQCTRAPLSLDDDEGNNEMPEDQSSWNSTMSMMPTPVAPPFTLSKSTITPWGTSIPTGTPCRACDKHFNECISWRCRGDGSDAAQCAKFCLASVCYDSTSADICKSGTCKPAACPKDKPVNFETADPAGPFTTVMSLLSTTITVTPTPTYGEPILKASPTPICTHGQEISAHAKWTVLLEHKIHQRPDNATLTWNLWDEHGCHAGNGMSLNVIVGRNISADIGAMGRPQKDMMGYMLFANVTESMTLSSSEIHFQISKPVADCQSMCHTSWKVNNRDSGNSWQIVNDCAQACGTRELGPEDVHCDDGMNKWQDNGDSPTNIRGGYCTFRMPFEPMDDSAPPPPAPWTRDSRWYIDFIQQMEYETASIEWWLRDPDGRNVSHFVKDLGYTPEQNQVTIETDVSIATDKRMRYKMVMSVDHPMDKDKTTVKLTYNSGLNKHCHYCKEKHDGMGNGWLRCPAHSFEECQPSYQTETNDEKQQSFLNVCAENGSFMGRPNSPPNNQPCDQPMIARNDSFSCDPVPAAFYPKNAGFERRFKCWWPNDFDEPYGRDDAPPPKDQIHWQLDIDPDTYHIPDIAGITGTAAVMGIDGSVNGTCTNATWR